MEQKNKEKLEQEIRLFLKGGLAFYTLINTPLENQSVKGLTPEEIRFKEGLTHIHNFTMHERLRNTFTNILEHAGYARFNPDSLPGDKIGHIEGTSLLFRPHGLPQSGHDTPIEIVVAGYKGDVIGLSRGFSYLMLDDNLAFEDFTKSYYQIASPPSDLKRPWLFGRKEYDLKLKANLKAQKETRYEFLNRFKSKISTGPDAIHSALEAIIGDKTAYQMRVLINIPSMKDIPKEYKA